MVVLEFYPQNPRCHQLGANLEFLKDLWVRAQDPGANISYARKGGERLPSVPGMTTHGTLTLCLKGSHRCCDKSQAPGTHVLGLFSWGLELRSRETPGTRAGTV